MKRIIAATLLALWLVASIGSAAFAVSGYVAIGGLMHNGIPDGHAHPIVTGEIALSDRFVVTAAKLLDDSDLRIGVRYGAGTGVFGDLYIYSEAINAIEVGVFFERSLSDRLDVRAMIAAAGTIFEDEWFVIPQAIIGVRYDLAGPLAVVGEISYAAAGIGIAYEF